MPRTLLVTNDFPPTIGGIQSYLRDFLGCLDPNDVVVFASTQDAEAAQEFDSKAAYTVVRWPRKVMLPTAATSRRMQELIRAHNIDTVWFGAAAPLALMGKAAKQAGAKKVVATTHGHEVGWSMLPGARQALRLIGNYADCITYISQYTLQRFHKAFGPHPRWVHMPSAVSVGSFQAATESKSQAKEHFGLVDAPSAPVILCVSRLVPRKGQDQLLRAMPIVRGQVPDAQLLIIGRGRYRSTLEVLAKMYAPDAIIQEAKDDAELSLAFAAGDVFAMPVRTRGGGLDVEGLGIVYLEAQAAQLPVIAGNSGGAPETITAETGVVIDGNNVQEIADALVTMLSNPQQSAAMGQAGREHVEENWTWDVMGKQLRIALNPDI
ncbi:glycosyltransferase family 4 protein [Corynebacterium ammoniagenes]|nr:glycosyltransferase family 4 protein [Corynebacterium ammoniagenes]NMF31113.1 glycosyltransferase family 4 protein [Corynebacterium ammoniagenes]